MRADIRPRPPASTGRGAAEPFGRAAAYRAARSFFLRDKRRLARQAGAMFRLTHDGDVARLTLDRPAARNAIPAAGWRQLERLIATVEGRLLVVSGAGGAFCAGADLGDLQALRRAEMRAALDALRDLAMPTVARID